MFRLIAIAGTLAASTAMAAEGDQVRGEIQGDGISGTVEMTETASGLILADVMVQGLSEGEHGIHIHETGKCDASEQFKTAGGHVAGDMKHGVKSEGGPHPGDLPNLHVPADGSIHVSYFVDGLTLGEGGDMSLIDDDGAALIIHSGADDYETQPSGDSGDRVACAVLSSS
ncbi:superoxide dismutase family protein [Rhizobium sp. L1K21]|uniref:superoxide dismutase family protein n=1 Tax=Rhizobium sp. L1K21 TaxID=2954933 RepID=UPI0020930188|nr:superoxide dismutase family protein [Rhizobium sp. L1K21]MCO6187807.1 superoxide dismutase family protein [Rhizobium sp. L1K21]